MVELSLLVMCRWPSAVEAKIKNRFDVVLNKGDVPLTQMDLKEVIKSYDAAYR